MTGTICACCADIVAAAVNPRAAATYNADAAALYVRIKASDGHANMKFRAFAVTCSLRRPPLRFGKAERDVLTRVIAAADCDDDVLTHVHDVGHRRPALDRRHPDRADLLPRRLVIRAQHRSSRVLR